MGISAMGDDVHAINAGDNSGDAKNDRQGCHELDCP